jgi:hypothetical protein
VPVLSLEFVGYQQLAQMVQQAGLKMQAVMSFRIIRFVHVLLSHGLRLCDPQQTGSHWFLTAQMHAEETWATNAVRVFPFALTPLASRLDLWRMFTAFAS